MRCRLPVEGDRVAIGDELHIVKGEIGNAHVALGKKGGHGGARRRIVDLPHAQGRLVKGSDRRRSRIRTHIEAHARCVVFERPRAVAFDLFDGRLQIDAHIKRRDGGIRGVREEGVKRRRIHRPAAETVQPAPIVQAERETRDALGDAGLRDPLVVVLVVGLLLDRNVDGIEDGQVRAVLRPLDREDRIHQVDGQGARAVSADDERGVLAHGHIGNACFAADALRVGGIGRIPGDSERRHHGYIG